MEVTIKRVKPTYEMECFGASGNSAKIDLTEAGGGNGAGVSPMEMVLFGLAGCASIDVIQILSKQKVDIDSYEVKVNAERTDIGGAKPFSKIHMHFILKGSVDEGKLKRAIDLSTEKYCSVSKMLEKSAEITTDFEIIS